MYVHISYYPLPSSPLPSPKAGGSGVSDGVEVALDPQEIEEMGMDAATTAK